MKNNNIRVYGAVIGLIVLVAIVIWVARSAGPATQAPTAAQNASTSAPATAGSSAPAAKASMASPAKTVVSIPVKPVSTQSNYVTYATNLAANQSSCKEVATKQYGQLYSSLEQASLQTYFNTKTNQCYAKITGAARPAYSTTTIGEVFFRSVNANAVLAQCTDSKGVTYSDGDWLCTDKTTGQTVSMAQFNSLLTRYTVQ